MAIGRHRLAPLLVIVGTLMFGSVTGEDFPAYNLNPIPITVTLGASSSPIIIRNMNFGMADYENSVNYTFIIRSGVDPLVLVFTFRSFNLEYDRSCRYDALYLQGNLYCGTWPARRQFPYLVMEQSDFTVRFKTDKSIRKSGFQIVVKPELAGNVYDDIDENSDYLG